MSHDDPVAAGRAMEARSQDVLRDGTLIADLVDEEHRTVSARVLSDPDIHELELLRVFDRTWVFVAHDSEVPSPGDYVARYIGADAVIVARDRSGVINVLLNSCSHRGSQVCRAEAGTTSVFRCPYHGWTYDCAGNLRGVSEERDAYPSGIDKSSMGLKRARVGTYQGLVFASWNESAPSLEDYLGDMRWYLDIVFGLNCSGMSVAGPPQRWVVPANWKLGADNFSADGYHAAYTHRSMGDIGLIPRRVLGRAAVNVHAHDRGHGVRCVPLADPHDPPTLVDLCTRLGLSPENAASASEMLSPEQQQVLRTYAPGVGTVFPNFSWLSGLLPSRVGGPPEPITSIRLWHPRGAEAMEVWSWALVHNDALDSEQSVARRAVIRTFGSSGMFEQDDAEAWAGVQRAVSGVQGRERRLTYLSTVPPDDSGWPGPGVVRPGFSGEDNQWNFYSHWKRLMSER